MAELPVEIVQITGGFALHLSGCDCPERQAEPVGAHTRRRFPASSVADAMARFMTSSPGVPITLGLVLRRGCIANLPYEDPTPPSADTMEAVHTRTAALSVFYCAQNAERRSADSTAELGHGSLHPDGTPVTTWLPTAGDLDAKIRHADAAMRWRVCMAGVSGEPKTTEDCALVVMQAEKAIRDATDYVMDLNSQHCDDMERAMAQVRRRAAAHFVREARMCLAPLHAWRSTPNAIRADQKETPA